MEETDSFHCEHPSAQTGLLLIKELCKRKRSCPDGFYHATPVLNPSSQTSAFNMSVCPRIEVQIVKSGVSNKYRDGDTV